MSWEDAVNSDSDGVNYSAFVNNWNSDKMSDSDEDDATAKELARERAEKQKLADFKAKNPQSVAPLKNGELWDDDHSIRFLRAR